jgi:hypothetical protein
LVVLCDFKGLQDFQTTFGGFQIFSSLSPPFSRILDPARPHSVAPRGMGSSALSRSRAFVLQECRGRVHDGGVIRIERNFNLARSLIIRKKNVDISSARQRDDSFTSTGEMSGADRARSDIRIARPAVERSQSGRTPNDRALLLPRNRHQSPS